MTSDFMKGTFYNPDISIRGTIIRFTHRHTIISFIMVIYVYGAVDGERSKLYSPITHQSQVVCLLETAKLVRSFFYLGTSMESSPSVQGFDYFFRLRVPNAICLDMTDIIFNGSISSGWVEGKLSVYLNPPTSQCR